MIILAQERERAPTLDRLGFENRVGLIGFELLLGDAGSHASAVSGQGCGSGWPDPRRKRPFWQRPSVQGRSTW